MITSIVLFVFIVGSHAATTNHFFRQTEECSKCLVDCREDVQYPNIAQGFRGYNPVLGNLLPLGTSKDPGYKAIIFDEESERVGSTRFGNTAGSALNRCNGNVRADFFQSSEEFLSSITEMEGSQGGFKVGPELKISGKFGKKGAAISASTTIPPIYQSMGSNSEVMTDTTNDMTINDRRVARSRFQCYSYEFDIKDAQHPKLTKNFKNYVVMLDDCLSSLSDYTKKTEENNECVRKFIENYGTHYIKSARFGSAMSVITIIDNRVEFNASRQQIEECATESDQWSMVGLVGGGGMSKKCEDSIFDKNSVSQNMILTEKTVTIGSRPKADYTEWAKQDDIPEIIYKEIAPVSELFTKQFLKNKNGYVIDDDRFDADGNAKVKQFLDNYILDYCFLFPSQCTHVVKMPYCRSEGNNYKYVSCHCKPIESHCGIYTGEINENFLPHGEGRMRIGGKDISSKDWKNGALPGADVAKLGYVKLPIMKISMSSEYTITHLPASNCIDGDINSICASSASNSKSFFPYILIEFPNESRIQKVVINNRIDCCWERTKNLKIFTFVRLVHLEDYLSESHFVPTNGAPQLFNEYEGPGFKGETITLEGDAKDVKYMVIQMNTDIINLAEIQVYGASPYAGCCPGSVCNGYCTQSFGCLGGCAPII